MNAIDNIDQVTPAWLTGILREHDQSGHCEVVEVVCSRSRSSGLMSRRYHLELKYSEDAKGTLPKRLFLKIGRPQYFDSSKREVTYWRELFAANNGFPDVHCYDAAYSVDTRSSHLLFSDVSDNYYALNDYPLSPSLDHCLQAVACLARNHAVNWGKALGKIREESLDGRSLVNAFDSVKRSAPSFFDFLGDRLTTPRRVQYEKLLEKFPALLKQRMKEESSLTLMHGDAHYWNFMFPRNDNQQQALLLDWSEWEIGIGCYDLAFMIACFWYPDRRQRHEAAILNQYHKVLLENGVSSYSRQECDFDYRLGIMRNLILPIYMWNNNMPASIWLPRMELSFFAFEDLGCDLLLNKVNSGALQRE